MLHVRLPSSSQPGKSWPSAISGTISSAGLWGSRQRSGGTTRAAGFRRRVDHPQHSCASAASRRYVRTRAGGR